MGPSRRTTLALAVALVLPLTPAAAAAPAGATSSAPGAATTPSDEQVVVPAGELTPVAADGTRTWVVQVDGDTDHAEDDLAAAGVEITAEHSAALTGFTVEATEEQVRDLVDAGVVQTAEADVVMALPDTPVTATATRPVPNAWNLDRVDQRFLPLDAKVTTPDRPGEGVRVYVVDTGVGPHPDLAGRLAPGHTTVLDGRGTDDCEGHGTHVAGTVASAEYGLATSATVVPVRVLDCAGDGKASDVVAALDWILAHHPAGVPGVVNMSLTGPASPTVDTAVRNAHAAGLLVVVAAGNDGGVDACTLSPARVPEAITVGATDAQDRYAGFSNLGGCLDLFAPGVDIVSTYRHGQYAIAEGTSMAAPLVSAIAAIHAANGITGSAALTKAIKGGSSPILSTPSGTTTALASLFTDRADVVPPAPTGVKVTSVTDTTVTLSYALGGAGAAVTEVRAQVRPAGTTSWSARPPVGPTARSSTVDGLAPSTTYELRVVSYARGRVPAVSSAVRATTSRATTRQIVISPDLTGDGRDDVLRIDTAGTLWLHPGNGKGAPGKGLVLGTGWATTRLFAPGDWDGDGRNDLISTTADGKLWLHPGTGKASAVGARRQIGHGWSTYRIVPVGDANKDGRADLFGIDSSGRLWLYPGRGGGRFGQRVQVGHGWNGYELYAAGDVNGDRLVDIYSIDSAGRLYQYRGRGGGRFYAKEQVGHGWNGYLFASGADLDRDGRYDLLGKDAGGDVYFYGRLRDGRFTKTPVAKGW